MDKYLYWKVMAGIAIIHGLDPHPHIIAMNGKLHAGNHFLFDNISEDAYDSLIELNWFWDHNVQRWCILLAQE